MQPLKTICILHLVSVIVSCLINHGPDGHVLLSGLLLNFKCSVHIVQVHSPRNLLHKVPLYHIINTFLNLHLNRAFEVFHKLHFNNNTLWRCLAFEYNRTILLCRVL